MIFTDYHVHSDYSDDSWYLMEDVVKDAIKLGLAEICFTDHVDYGVKEDWQATDTYLVGANKVVKNVYYDLYFNELARLKETYSDQIKLKTGLEFGIQMHTIPQFTRLYHSHPFDFIFTFRSSGRRSRILDWRISKRTQPTGMLRALL